MLEIKNLAIGYDDAPLIAGFSFKLAQGAAATIVGPSGCGKSTLLRTVATLIDPVAGEVTLDGRPPRQWAYPQYRRQVLYVDQKPILLDATVEVNLALPSTYRSATHRYERAAAADLLERLGLGRDIIDQPAQSLSVGQQQRVCLVRALLVRPRYLLLDEPTSALDEDNQQRVIELLRDQTEASDLGVLMVTHQVHHMDRLAGQSLDLTGYVAGKGADDG